LFCQEERFYLVLFFFSYLLIAVALIAIDIASNRWRGLRAATRSADLLIETVIFPTVLQCIVNFDQLPGSGCNRFEDFRTSIFSILYIFGK
jgi:hypothetical protein